MFVVIVSTWEENVEKFQDVSKQARGNVSSAYGIVDIEWSFNHVDHACKLFRQLSGREYNDLVYGIKMTYYIE